MMIYEDAVAQVRSEAPELEIMPFNPEIPKAVVVKYGERMFSIGLVPDAGTMSHSIRMARENFS